MQFNRLQAAGVAVILAWAGYTPTASAQAWIGQIVGNMMAQQAAAQQEEACMTGTPMPPEEVTEARTPALAVMRAYYASAGADGRISPHFNLDKRTRWIDGEAGVGMAEIDRQRDRFAHGGLSLDPVPLGFVRAGDGASALGQWVARDAAGAVGGTYTARFTRSGGVWRLSTLQLTPARQYIDPVEQYCHKSGDVLPYRLSNARWWREQAERRAVKAAAKAAKADAALAKASGNAAAQTKARAARTTLEQRQTELDAARTVEAKALADAAEAESRKAKAIAALAAGS
ncbi:hypothetical protein [Sphingomonas koreensis]